MPPIAPPPDLLTLCAAVSVSLVAAVTDLRQFKVYNALTIPALIGGLSYSALSAFENCGYRFYVERVLGIAEPEVVSVGGDEPAGPEVRRRFGPGLAVHSLLEWSARNHWREPSDERVAAALREQGLATRRRAPRSPSCSRWAEP